MKAVINIILVACVVGLLYLCYASIMGPIEFEKAKKLREKEVIARLIDIREAQVNFRNMHQGGYTDSFDELINFVKTAQLPFVKKEGELTDEQMENGLTEFSAMEMINKAKKTGKWGEVEKNGLTNFSRDTMWVNLIDTIFGRGFNADSLQYVPYGNGTKFEMEVKVDSSRAGTPLYLFEARTPYTVYLEGLNKQEIVNLIDLGEKLGRYCGLKVGDVENPNNNAGNWE